MKKIFLLVVQILFLSLTTEAQISQEKNSKFIELGKTVPDFVIRNLENYPKKELSIRDLRGKWVYLDFWAKSCTSCIESFPYVDSLKRQFGKSVEFFLVGREDKEGDAKHIYRNIFERLKMQLPCAFDSVVFKKLDIFAGPYIVLIDPNGIVRAVTTHISKDKMTDIIAGKQVQLTKAYREHEEVPRHSFDGQQLFLIDGNGGSDTSFLFRSVLSSWNPTVSRPGEYWADINMSVRKGIRQFIGVSADVLFFSAYLGVDRPTGVDPVKRQQRMYQADEFFPKVILEVRDTSLFNYDYKSGKNMFSYSLKFPKEQASVQKVMKMMQRDLASYFNLLATIEEREFSYWKLVASKEARKKYVTNGDSTYKKFSSNYGIHLRNQPPRAILTWLYNPQDNLPLGEGTEIDGNIDIDLNYAAVSFDDYKKALREKGFDLVKSTKKMKCLVIRDIEDKPMAFQPQSSEKQK